MISERESRLADLGMLLFVIVTSNTYVLMYTHVCMLVTLMYAVVIHIHTTPVLVYSN
jgi:hypothetical protein